MGLKIEKEKRIIATMIGLYCRKTHGTKRGSLCAECRELQDYAHQRLIKCPFQDDKPVCRECRVHCYKPDYRQRVRAVMRFSGPRLLLYHPIEWVKHTFGG